MKHFGMKFLAVTCLCLAASVAQASDAAAKYPEKMIRIVVPYAPGGFNDTMGRLFAKRLQQDWGQPVVVENKGGAGTIVGTEMVARAKPDGYTLLINGFPFILNQYLHKHLPYNTEEDFVPVIGGAQAYNLLVVRADSPIKSMADLIKRAKDKQGTLNYASAGVGSSNHVTMEYFKSETGTNLMQIPFKGSSPMVAALLGGQVDVMFDNVPNVLPLVKAGKLRALAITSNARSSLAPDVPTVAEQGYPNFEVSVPYGVFVPAGTPAAIVEKLNAELRHVLSTPEVQRVFKNQSVEAMGGSPAQFQKYIQSQMAKWSKVVQKAGIKAE